MDDVAIQIGFHKSAVRTRLVEDPAEKQKTLEQFVTESSELAGYLFGWESGRDSLETAGFSLIIEQVLIIRM